MTKHRRLNFTDHVKAEIYAGDKAICAFCGCDLWMVRHGASPFTGHDWADHIRPSARGGSNSPDNGITACDSCNSKKSDNTRDREYFFKAGNPTNLYFNRFDHPNPLVAEAAQANDALEWTDWYFNRAIAKLMIAVTHLHDLALGGIAYKRTPEYWLTAGLRFASDWRRYDPTGIERLKSRGLLPAAQGPDQAKILKFFECVTLEESLEVARSLVPSMVGHRLFYALKCHAYSDPELGQLIISMFGQGSSDEAIETFLRHPYVAEHALVSDLDGLDIAHRDGDHLVPVGLPGWPQLPEGKMASLVSNLTRAQLGHGDTRQSLSKSAQTANT